MFYCLTTLRYIQILLSLLLGLYLLSPMLVVLEALRHYINSALLITTSAYPWNRCLTYFDFLYLFLLKSRADHHFFDQSVYWYFVVVLYSYAITTEVAIEILGHRYAITYNTLHTNNPVWYKLVLDNYRAFWYLYEAFYYILYQAMAI